MNNIERATIRKPKSWYGYVIITFVGNLFRKVKAIFLHSFQRGYKIFQIKKARSIIKKNTL
ncbi:MAG: hypothetical protein DCE86_18325 [Flavobacteriaceae bacterium]|nr:MAG: hypothetical protein DCE86_18325 [Flavobacteriaceae bacterium]